MKDFKLLCTLMLTALTFAACSNDEIVEPEQTTTDAGITFTAIFGVKNGTTRALTDPGDGMLTASWQVNEQIAIVYGGNKYTASVTEVDGDGNATVTATLPGSIENNQAVTFIYPASAADGSGLRSDLLANQDGTLATLSSEFDVATADGTLVVDGTAAQPNGTVTLVNQFAICKFQFKDLSNTPITDIESVNITDLSTSEMISVTTPSPQSAVYVAMKPSRNSTKFEVLCSDEKFYSKTSNANLQAGLFYQPTLKMTSAFNPKTTPLTFEAKTEGAKMYIDNPFAQSVQLEYSKNGGEWTTYGESDIYVRLEHVGDKVSFRGNNTSFTTSNNQIRFMTPDGDIYVYGNIMSLLNKTEFATATTLPSEYVFTFLFSNNANLYNHPTYSLVLPATELTEGCYYGMFQSCTNLTKAPDLPATTLKEDCYFSMFGGCTSLTKAPDLPATTLAVGCYYFMFDGCTSLQSIKCLATDISAENCTHDWLVGVASTGTFTKAASMSSWPTGTSGIPSGWTVVDE